MNDSESNLRELVRAILASPKYGNVSEDFIANIGSRELAKRRSLKEAVKATKNKLHQVGGAYLDGRANYALWIDELKESSRSSDREDLLRVCSRIMKYHSSTRERLRVLEEFYTTTLADLPPIRTILDIACGFNPLSIPWMPLAEDARYYAYDIYRDMTSFLSEFIGIVGVRGGAEVCDVIESPPARRADLALVLKIVPCLEQVDKSAGLKLLDVLNADRLLVSFPVYSLCGRGKGMAINYEDSFHNLVAEKNWEIRQFEFDTELAFLVTKWPAH